MTSGDRLHIPFQQDAVKHLLTIIIPVKDDGEGLRQTLESIAATVPAEQAFEVIVANDGGADAITQACKHYAWVEEKVLVPNRGPGGARNEALKYAKGEYIAFLDADVIVRPGWWEALNAVLAEHDYAAGRVDIHPDMMEHFFHHYDALTAFNVREYMTHHHGVTANVAVRRSLLEQIGGFDARFRSGEDSEFGVRVHEAGCRLVYADAMAIYHPPRGFTEQRKKLYRVVVGHVQLYQAWPERFARYRISLRMVLSFLLPPRKVAKYPDLMRDYSLPYKIGFYLTAYATRLYRLACYMWLHRSSADQKQHDLS